MPSDPRTSTTSIATYWARLEAMIPPDVSHYKRWMRLAFFAGFNDCFNANCAMAYEDKDIVDHKLEQWSVELDGFLAELGSATAEMREDALLQQADIDAGTHGLCRIPRGQWKIIRTSGIVEVRVGKPTINAITKAICASCLDSINLRQNGRVTGTVMFVDDTGAVDGRAPNKVASELYWAQCHLQGANPIRGDVALVNDTDFG